MTEQTFTSNINEDHPSYNELEPDILPRYVDVIPSVSFTLENRVSPQITFHNSNVINNNLPKKKKYLRIILITLAIFAILIFIAAPVLLGTLTINQ